MIAKPHTEVVVNMSRTHGCIPFAERSVMLHLHPGAAAYMRRVVDRKMIAIQPFVHPRATRFTALETDDGLTNRPTP